MIPAANFGLAMFIWQADFTSIAGKPLRGREAEGRGGDRECVKRGAAQPIKRASDEELQKLDLNGGVF